MRKFNIFIVLAFLFTSCVVDDLQYIENGPRDIESGIKIFGTVQDFDVKKVTTRADEGSSELPSDSFISEMTMFVFKGDGKLIQGYRSRTVTSYDDKNNAHVVTYNDDDKCSSAINLQKANPTFLIDTQDGLIASLDGDSPTVIFYDHKAEDLAKCKIYIVANAWHALEPELDKIKTLADLEAITLDIDDNLSMPKKDDGSYRGFPMIGTHRKFANNEGADTFDLRKTGENKAGAVAKIPLKKLFSKVSFTIQVNANEVVNTPKFKLEKVEVFNVPSKARLGRELDSNGKPTYKNSEDYIVEMVGKNSYTTKDYYHFTEQPKELPNTSFSRTEISHTTQKKLTEGSEYLIEFGFYMPEHKVTPNYNSSTFTGYPDNIDEDFKQYYKPDLVEAVRNGGGTTTNGKNATFVRIHGKYTDHNGQIKNVRYDIYLGQNNTDDFTVKRNQLLTNKLVITGLTNYHDAYGDNQQNISVDHRVDVDYAGFNLSMERTAILDSHFEVRPLDIELQANSSMTITIPKEYRRWIAMEDDAAARSGVNSGLYVNTSYKRKGVRKYFTTDLVRELNGTNGGTVTVAHSGANPNKTEIHRIWFYIDENPNVYDKTLPGQDAQGNNIDYSTNNATDSFNTTYNISKNLYRLGKVNFFYSGDGTDPDTSSTPTTVVNMQQWNLWRVWSAPNENGVRERYYDIEHEEEYLNNYASDVQYGPAKDDGMVYGLENVQLSDSEQSIVASQSGYSLGTIFNSFFTSITDMANTALNNVAKYDFYLPRDFEDIILTTEQQSSLTIREYSGRAFNEEIAATLKANYPTHQIESYKPEDYPAQIDKLYLTQDPQSAFAYCYHKNKRNDNGVVENQKWYLPAIDEIEDIAAGAYDEFDQVFQNKKYWSCQPAYNKESLKAKIVTKLELGEAYLLADYYVDNIKRARATSIVITIENGKQKPNNIPSHTPGYSGKREGNANGIYSSWLDVTLDGFSFDVPRTDIPISDEEYAKVPGNLPRTTNCRIRAVYRSGTK